MDVIHTDYDNYEITYGNPRFAGLDVWAGIWIRARTPVQPGTAEYDDWYAKVSNAMATYWPTEAMDDFRVQPHNSRCTYTLGEPSKDSKKDQVETPQPEDKEIPDWCAFVPGDPECNPTI